MNGTPHQSDETTPVGGLESELLALRKSFIGLLKTTFWVLLVVIVAFVVALAVTLSTNWVASETHDKMGIAGSLQVGLGMILGFVCVFYGLMMSWLAITANYSVKAAVQSTGTSGSLDMIAASPGLVFFAGGVFLIGLSLYKPLTFESSPAKFVPVPSDTLGVQPPNVNPPPPPVRRDQLKK